jgi:hypothetical protein
METAIMEQNFTAASEFDYVRLQDIDPSFQALEEDVYNLRILKAEAITYTAKKDTKTAKSGDEAVRYSLQFAVQGHPKYSGRRIFETLFPNDFTWKVFRRIMDATGIPQGDLTISDWLVALTQTQPAVRLKVEATPDVLRDGTPNPKNVRPDGSPGLKNVIAWKAGVQPGLD